MTRRERLLNTLAGLPVDRPAVSFYEINGLDEYRSSGADDRGDPFDIYTDPSWRPLIELARERTDRIVMRPGGRFAALPDPSAGLGTTTKRRTESGEITARTVRVGKKILRMETRRDFDVNTVWTTEHLLKAPPDVEAFLSLPVDGGDSDTGDIVRRVREAESQLGDTGIVMLDTPDPLCLAATLFEMADFTVIAHTERTLFRRLLDRFAESVYPQIRQTAKALPGRLWRVHGPEYASPPYLPPQLFREYVGGYDAPIVDAIHSTNGYARIHCHGNLADILPIIAETDWDAIDPIEPPPQGDVSLRSVAETYGDRWVLFGNLEISDIENMPTREFAEVVRGSVEEGAAPGGRGFVLMPSSCPYGRTLSDRTIENYRAMVEAVRA